MKIRTELCSMGTGEVESFHSDPAISVETLQNIRGSKTVLFWVNILTGTGHLDTAPPSMERHSRLPYHLHLYAPFDHTSPPISVLLSLK